MRILIADDHELVRDAIEALLREEFGSLTIGEAVNGLDTIEQVNAQEWDLVILDLGLPLINGIVVLKLIKQELPHLPVLVFSLYSDHAFARECLRSGASGYLCKPDGADDLGQAVRTILNGGTFFSSELDLGDLAPRGRTQPDK